MNPRGPKHTALSDAVHQDNLFGGLIPADRPAQEHIGRTSSYIALRLLELFHANSFITVRKTEAQLDIAYNPATAALLHLDPAEHHQLSEAEATASFMPKLCSTSSTIPRFCVQSSNGKFGNMPITPELIFTHLEALRKRLIDISNRNKLVSFRPTKKACMEILFRKSASSMRS